MTRSTPAPTANVTSNTGRSAASPAENTDSFGTLLDALALRDALREATARASRLVRALKQDRRQSKAL